MSVDRESLEDFSCLYDLKVWWEESALIGVVEEKWSSLSVLFKKRYVLIGVIESHTLMYCFLFPAFRNKPDVDEHLKQVNLKLLVLIF